MMISSVDGSSASNYTSPQSATDTSPATQLPQNDTGSSVKSAVKSAHVQAGNPSHDIHSDESNNSKNIDNNQVKTNSEAEDFQLKKAKNTDDQLLGNYGNNKDDSEQDYSLLSKQTASFAELAAVVGSNGSKITKEQLVSYYASLTSKSGDNGINPAEVTLIKNLIAKFEELSHGGSYITSLKGIDEPQDYTTITPEQVTSPIDIRV